jgi:hypothetical protein
MNRPYLCIDCKQIHHTYTYHHRGTVPLRCPECLEAHRSQSLVDRAERYRRKKGILPRNQAPIAERRRALVKVYDKYGLTWKGRNDDSK